MLHREAARIIEDVANKRGAVKTLVFASTFSSKKQLYALVCETLKYNKILDAVLDGSQLMKYTKGVLKSRPLAKCLVYSLLFGKGLPGGKCKKFILSHQTSLRAELERLKVKAKVSTIKDLLPDEIRDQAQLPRYVRVNGLKTTLDDVVTKFKTEGYTLIDSLGLEYSRFLEAAGSLDTKHFMQDPHVDNLLVFSPKTDLHSRILYKKGDIIFQDKASCLPAYVLDPPPGGHVVDCCAAPGNKTSHAAAIMKNKGQIFSFDLDAKRLATMNSLTLKAGVMCAELKNQDFLKVNVHDPKYSSVEYLIVDPSCSGSGIVSRMNHVTDDGDSITPERLQKLANFQTMILKHALSFPNAKRVVYSTCSVHEEENEKVVKEVFEHVQDQFFLKEILPELPHRGQKGSFAHSKCCVRMLPSHDLTNGFFVACFERRAEKFVDIGHGQGSSANNICDRIDTDIGQKGLAVVVHKKKKAKKKKKESPIVQVASSDYLSHDNKNSSLENSDKCDNKQNTVNIESKSQIKTPRKRKMSSSSLVSIGQSCDRKVQKKKKKHKKKCIPITQI